MNGLWRVFWYSAFAIPCAMAFAESMPSTVLRLSDELTLDRAASARTGATPSSSSLSSLIERAWREHPEVNSSKMTESASQARIDRAAGLLRPQISLGGAASENHVSESWGSFNEHYLTGQGNLNYPLYRPRLQADLDVARSGREESQEASRETATDLALRIVTTYIELINQRQDRRALEAEQRLVESLLVVNQRRLDGGVGSLTEVTESALRNTLLATQTRALRQDIEVQRLELRRLSCDSGADAGELRDIEIRLVPTDIAVARGELERNNPSLRRARQVAEMARIRRESETKNARPNVDLVGRVEWGRSSVTESGTSAQTSTSLGVQMSMPLYTAGVLGASQREAVAQESKAEYDFRAAKDRLNADLTKAYADLEKFDGQIDANRRGLELARSVSDRTRKSYMAGYRNNIDVINAQRQISEVERDLAKARAGAVLAQARILGLMGRLDAIELRRMDAMFGQPVEP
jgi:outer membrane protein TolC